VISQNEKIARQSRAICYSHAPFARKKNIFLDIFLQENLHNPKLIRTFAA
jgi:hypothetical protein